MAKRQKKKNKLIISVIVVVILFLMTLLGANPNFIIKYVKQLELKNCRKHKKQ